MTADEIVEKLQCTLDNFCLEQDKQVFKLRREIEALLMRQQSRSEMQRGTSGSQPIADDGTVRQGEPKAPQPSGTLDTAESGLPMLEDEDSFDPDAIDLLAPESSSSDDIGITTPCLAQAGPQKRGFQSNTGRKLLGSWHWDGFVNTRRLHCDTLNYIVHHNYYVCAVVVLILVNTAYLGVVAHLNMKASMHQYDGLKKKVSFRVGTPEWELDLDLVFVLLFTTEIVLRVLADEVAFFFGEDWAWNWLDLFIVATTDFEYVAKDPSVRMFRLLRMVRSVRSLRLLANFHMFTKFRVLALAFQHSLLPLTSVCALLFAMFYVASTIFVSGATEYLRSGFPTSEAVAVLYSYFGGLDQTVLTLFMCITGGVSWEVAVGALTEVHVAYGFLFVVFIASMMLGALNIIAGIFVNDAIEMAQHDRQVVLQADFMSLPTSHRRGVPSSKRTLQAVFIILFGFV